MTRRPYRAALAAALAAAVFGCQAQPSSPGGAASGPSGKPPGPPPEAVQACQGKAAGTAVSFSMRDGRSFSGTCQNVNGTLAALPAAGSGGPPR